MDEDTACETAAAAAAAVSVAVEEGLVECAVEAACVETGVAAVLTTGELAEDTAAACVAMIGFSSDCWITFTPSGLVQADSRVRAL